MPERAGQKHHLVLKKFLRFLPPTPTFQKNHDLMRASMKIKGEQTGKIPSAIVLFPPPTTYRSPRAAKSAAKPMSPDGQVSHIASHPNAPTSPEPSSISRCTSSWATCTAPWVPSLSIHRPEQKPALCKAMPEGQIRASDLTWTTAHRQHWPFPHLVKKSIPIPPFLNKSSQNWHVPIQKPFFRELPVRKHHNPNLIWFKQT